MSENDYQIHVKGKFGYRFIDVLTVFSMISKLVVCKKCGIQIKFSETGHRGLGYKVVVTCEKCKPTYINASPVISNHAYDINRRIILAMRLLGVGLNGIIKFCAFMDLPRPIFQSFYDKLVKNISVATATVREKCIKKAAVEKKKMNEEKGITDGITVSGDGTWRKRGFSSLYGITTLIGQFTGKILDINVKSKYCKSCEIWKEKEGTTEYEEWIKSHNDECNINHVGSAGKMEVDAIVKVFSRSELLHGLKYYNYIGDGDSKTFKSVTDARPYKDLVVRKKECIDHVQKRMGR